MARISQLERMVVALGGLPPADAAAAEADAAIAHDARSAILAQQAMLGLAGDEVED